MDKVTRIRVDKEHGSYAVIDAEVYGRRETIFASIDDSWTRDDVIAALKFSKRMTEDKGEFYVPHLHGVERFLEDVFYGDIIKVANDGAHKNDYLKSLAEGFSITKVDENEDEVVDMERMAVIPRWRWAVMLASVRDHARDLLEEELHYLFNGDDIKLNVRRYIQDAERRVMEEYGLIENKKIA